MNKIEFKVDVSGIHCWHCHKQVEPPLYVYNDSTMAHIACHKKQYGDCMWRAKEVVVKGEDITV